MSEGKTSISHATSYKQAGEGWDEHDLGEWEQTAAAAFDVDIQSTVTYFPIESTLSKQLRKLAAQHGVSPETLLNLWIQERVGQEQADAA